MRLIEKLMERVKNRPRIEKACMISPFHICEPPEDYLGKWTATFHQKKKGKLETEKAGFETAEEAIAWAEEKTGKDGTIYIICETEAVRT